jgi:hypothetical protein
MSNDTRIAVDVAKAVFEVAISDRPGQVTRRERLPRGQFLDMDACYDDLPSMTVGLMSVKVATSARTSAMRGLSRAAFRASGDANSK